MNFIQFPGCCAGIILKDFGNTLISLDTKNYTLEDIRYYFKLADVKLERYGFVMLAINNDQLKVMKDLLKEFEYQCVAGAILSKGHIQSAVYIYIKYIQKEVN